MRRRPAMYRILAIDNQHMTLRAGGPSDDPQFTFKMRVKINLLFSYPPLVSLP